MKSRYIKRRKKFHYIIISVTIIVCLLGTVFTSLAILNSSKDLLVANAENELKMKMIDVEHNLGINLTDSQDDKVNGAYPYNDKVGLLNENVDKSNTYYQITDKKNLTISTDNVITVYYISQNRNYISFDVIKNLLSDNEYKEICGYLNTPTDNDGNYYVLICNKFYESEKYGYVPCQLEVVKTNKVNDWYVQDEVVKTYSFDLSKYDYLTIEELEATPFENDEMHRNIIDKDFFLGKDKPKYSQKNVEQILKDNALSYIDIYESPAVVNDGIFKCYLLCSDYYYNKENRLISDPNDSDYVYKVVQGSYLIVSLKEIDLLNDCLWKFITVFAVAFTIMAVVITVEIFSWKDFKRRTAQEETRLEMTNAIAHNLKTPLFVIGGFAENLKNEEDTEKKLHNIEIIQQQTEEMDILIHRMLDLSRFDSPALKLNCEVFDFKPFIEKILENYYVHTEHEIIFIYNSKAKIKADPAMLKTVLENLIDNAEKYSDYGSDITINVSDDVLSISNQCSSFDRENLSKLWQPYFRAAKGDNKSGSGIGLSIVKSALEMHGFKYKAEFENGIITFKFRFTKPRHISGCGVLTGGGQAVGRFERAGGHADLAGLVVHHLDEGAARTADAFGNSHRGVVAGRDGHPHEEAVQGNAFPRAQAHAGTALARGVAADADLIGEFDFAGPDGVEGHHHGHDFRKRGRGDPHVRILGIEYFACAGIHEHGGADIEDLSGRGALGGVGFSGVPGFCGRGEDE